MTEKDSLNGNKNGNNVVKEAIEDYDKLQGIIKEYSDDLSETLSVMDNYEEKMGMEAQEWYSLIEKEQEYEREKDEIKRVLDEKFYGEIGEDRDTIKEIMKDFDHLPISKDIEEMTSYLDEISEDLDQKLKEYSEDTGLDEDQFEDIYNARKEFYEAERNLNKLKENKGLDQGHVKKIYKTKKEMEKLQKEKDELKNRIDDVEGNGDEDLNILEDRLKMLKKERQKRMDLAESLPLTRDEIEEVYKKSKDLTERRKKYRETLSGLEEGDNVKERVEEVLQDYKKKIDLEKRTESMANEYKKLIEEGYGDEDIIKINEVVRESGTLEKKYEEFTEMLSNLKEELDKKENKKEMVKKGWEAYEKDGELFEIKGDRRELSFGSVMSMMSKLDPTDYDAIENTFEEYENKRSEKNLPELTPSLLSGNTDLETAKRYLLGVEGLSTKIKDPNDLVQFTERIDALENEEIKGSKEPGLAYKAGVVGISALLGAAVGSSELPGEDVELEWLNHGPALVENIEETVDITGDMDGQIRVNGTVETTATTGIDLDSENLSAGFVIPTREGNITITEQDGHLELATGNATIKLNETDADLNIEETTGNLAFEGSLAGDFDQELVSRFVGDEEDIDGTIDAQFVREERNERSLWPWLLAGGAAGCMYVGLKSSMNKIIDREKSDVDDRDSLVHLISEKYDDANRIGELTDEAWREVGKIMQDGLKDIKTESYPEEREL